MNPAVYQSPDWLAMVAGIVENPDADLPRLVAADWLEERGESGRAEFIRLQCGRIALPFAPWRWTKEGQAGGGPMCRHTDGERCEACRPFRRREIELLHQFGREWFGDGPLWLDCDDMRSAPRHAAHLIVGRGFVSAVRAPLSWLFGVKCERCEGDGYTETHPSPRLCRFCSGVGHTIGHLPEVMATHPITKATAADARPHLGRDGWFYWVRGRAGFAHGADTIPESLYELMPATHPDATRMLKGFAEIASAHAALSDAMLAWARLPVPA